MAGLMGFAMHCTYQGTKVGRVKAMSQEYIDTHLKEENAIFKKRYGYDIPPGAYPEMTDGKHAAKLDYETWLEYACNQRVHQNYLENLGIITIAGAIAGLSFPIATAISLLVQIVGRQVYSSGYRKNGPKGRLAGAPLLAPSLLSLIGMSLYTAYLHTSFAH